MLYLFNFIKRCHCVFEIFGENAVKLAAEMGITLCDCYAKWKEISHTQDTTDLLANYINHPTREMHELFAQSLFEMIFDDIKEVKTETASTMYQK